MNSPCFSHISNRQTAVLGRRVHIWTLLSRVHTWRSVGNFYIPFGLYHDLIYPWCDCVSVHAENLVYSLYRLRPYRRLALVKIRLRIYYSDMLWSPFLEAYFLV
uniref:Uncharacterized protein n=1 Tax=Cacopsylla melanoneura TaxID=428564 RepID=A0A8D8Q0X3_9HEMI